MSGRYSVFRRPLPGGRFEWDVHDTWTDTDVSTGHRTVADAYARKDELEREVRP